MCTDSIVKMLRNMEQRTNLCEDSQGRRALNMDDSIKILLDIHLPRSNVRRPQPVRLSIQNDGLVLFPEMVIKAVINVKPFKATITDSIFPALLQNGADLLSMYM